ncbi:MAG: UMP kinase [Acidilobus sp.]
MSGDRGQAAEVGFALRGEAVVVKLSGSLLHPFTEPYALRLRGAVESLVKEGLTVGLVVGGGPLARDLISPLRALRVPESLLDEVGIEAANLNALALSLALYPLSPPQVPRDVREAVRVAQEGLVPVMGGLQPGQSTNAVAAVLAEALRAKVLINLLNGVDGVYTGRPGEPGSRKLDTLSYDDLERILLGKSQAAGTYELFDHVALGVVKRSKITLVFADGRDPEVILRIARGEKVGSWVTP